MNSVSETVSEMLAGEDMGFWTIILILLVVGLAFGIYLYFNPKAIDGFINPRKEPPQYNPNIL
jgi:H+/Cl- antiporter ClcA